MILCLRFIREDYIKKRQTGEIINKFYFQQIAQMHVYRRLLQHVLAVSYSHLQ